MAKGLARKLIDCLHCGSVDHEEACCAFTGFSTPGADQPHGCPREIRIHVLHNLPARTQADVRTLVMRSLQRGQGEALLEMLHATSDGDRAAFQRLVMNTELADMHVEGGRDMLASVEGQRRWNDGPLGPRHQTGAAMDEGA
jgi:hypothetical protein